MSSGNRRILITGAGGLIGRETIKPLCEAGFEVFAVCRSKAAAEAARSVAEGGRVKFAECDLFDESALGAVFAEVKPQYLLNLAWKTTGDYLSSNLNFEYLRAGISMLEHFRKNGGGRAVYAGTCFEYKFKDSPLAESDGLDADKTAYTFCKDTLRRTAEYFCRKNSISFAYGRIFYVFGRGEDKSRLTGMIVDNLSQGREVVIKSGSLVKDYMYAADIAAAFAAIAVSDVSGAVNVCSGRGITVADFARSVAEKLGRPELLRFEEQPSNQPPAIVGDNRRLIGEVGFTPKYDLSSALDDMIFRR